MSSKSQTVYEAGLQNGFEDLDVWNYFSEETENSQINCKTPFLYNGKPLNGVAVVPLTHVEEGNLRESRDMMFITEDGENVEDVAEKSSGSRDYFVTDSRTGNPVSSDKALKEMGDFAAAVSTYPHVEVKGEFCLRMKVQDAINGNTVELATADYNHQYQAYLKNCLSKIQNGETFVGDRKKPDDLFADGEFIPGNERYSYYRNHGLAESAHIRTIHSYVNRSKSRHQTVLDAFGLQNTTPDGRYEGISITE